MKIFALVSGTYGERGGIGQSNRDLLDSLCDMENVTQIVTVPRLSSGVPEKVPEKIMQAKAFKNQFVYSIYTLIIFLKKGPFDLIFCGHLLMSPLAFVLKVISRVPYWIQLHGVDAWEKPSNIVRHSAEQALFNTAVSRFTRQQFLRWAYMQPHQVRVIPNTVQEMYQPKPKSQAIQNKYQLENKTIILTVGRLSSVEKYKGHDLVIQALSKIVKAVPNILYLIAGDGDDRKRIENLVKESNMENYVRFLGYVPDENLPDLYRSADLFVMASSGEGFGIVFIEAMACGIPAIGLEGDGSVDALLEGRLGTVTTLKDIADDIVAVLMKKEKDSKVLSEQTKVTFSRINQARHLKQVLGEILPIEKDRKVEC